MAENKRKKSSGFFANLDIDSLFDVSAFTVGTGYSYMPYTDIIETETHFIIEVELPGIAKEDIEIEATERQIILEGTKRRDDNPDCSHKQRYHYMGRTYGKFRRSFDISVPFNMHDVRATLENGLLVIVLPKLAEKRRSRIRIPVG